MFSQEVSVKQKDKWIKFTSPEGRFTVELPELPEQRTRVARLPEEEEADGALVIFRCTKSRTAYILRSVYGTELSRLVIMEVDVSKCERQKGDFELDMFRFIVFYGSDEVVTLNDKRFHINGLRARDFILTRGSRIRGRVLAIEAGKRIFVVMYDREI